MAGTAVVKCLRTLELLAGRPLGFTSPEVALELDIPRGAAERVLQSLGGRGFVRFDPATKRYALTMKLTRFGFAYLSRAGIVEVYQPILDRLAADTGELVRMAIAEGESITWVGVAQGSHTGLRIAPDSGEVCLHATATGKAWLATLPVERALALARAQGFAGAGGIAGEGALGPNELRSVAALVADLDETRRRGYALNVDEYIPGMSGVAVAIPGHWPGDPAIGTLTLSGPTARMDRRQLARLARPLAEAAAEISALWPIIDSQRRR